ncbi:hypothetical protein Droror1_Dr00022541 [Drosera rotundifolia]
MIEITERIDVFEDFEVMCKVSRRWRSAVKMAHFRCGGRSMIQFPWLMLSLEEGATAARFFSFSKEDMFRIVPLPKTTLNGRTMRLHSSHGWLLIVLSSECSLSLFNPLSGTYIQLPDNSSLDYEAAAFGCPFYVERFCLSCCPFTNPDDFQVMIVSGQDYKLALWRPGDSGWTPVETNHLDLIPDASFTDLTYYRGEFFAITLSALVLAVNTSAADTRGALRPGGDDGGKGHRGEKASTGDPVKVFLKVLSLMSPI